MYSGKSRWPVFCIFQHFTDDEIDEWKKIVCRLVDYENNKYGVAPNTVGIPSCHDSLLMLQY